MVGLSGEGYLLGEGKLSRERACLPLGVVERRVWGLRGAEVVQFGGGPGQVNHGCPTSLRRGCHPLPVLKRDGEAALEGWLRAWLFAPGTFQFIVFQYWFYASQWLAETGREKA